MTDLHLTRLAGWLLNTIGKAFGLSLLVAFVVAFIAAGVGSGLLYALAGLLGAATFAGVLYNASAPLPDDYEEGERVRNALDNGQL